MGSARFGHLVGLVTVAANVGFTAFCFLMAGFGTYEALFFQCQGFWVVLFGLIAVECLGSQEPTRQLFMIPVQIPTPYYPLALFALFSLFGGPSLGLAFGLAAGYGFAYGQASGPQASWSGSCARGGYGGGCWGVITRDARHGGGDFEQREDARALAKTFFPASHRHRGLSPSSLYHRRWTTSSPR